MCVAFRTKSSAAKTVKEGDPAFERDMKVEEECQHMAHYTIRFQHTP